MRIPVLLFYFLIGLICACQNTNENAESMKEEISQTEEEVKPSLASILEERKERSAKKADPNKVNVHEKGIKAIVERGTAEGALNVGDQAPDFALKNALGETIKLSNYLKKGPVIITWYRGGWCPYCNLTLQRLQEDLPMFKAEGANLIALTPEVPDKSLSTKEKNDLKFEVLSDLGNVVARKYGLVFKLIPEVAEAYKGFGLNEYNGDESDELPLSATYVIDQKGIIQYAFLDGDYRKRAEPKDIINALKKIK